GSEDPSKIIQLLKEEISDILTSAGKTETGWGKGLRVLLMVGVNGTGKTTSIGKLAVRFGKEGKKVLIAACDTFRAAAIEQLTIWSERAGAEIIKSQPKSDPAAVAYDAVQAGLARKADILIIDTAGRLQTNVNLMEELRKIKKVISKLNPAFPQETLLVLDATVGQNALSQVRLFKDSVNPTGIALTKLDGSAKGGIIIAIAQEFGLPVRYVGLGETAEDLEEFEPQEFVEALFA
ncbi:MAG: signal recognition particle-docking protein FtsY, partial [candidate division Zixibacteria bacterium]|nr:signal recognition particle-docking protein FtsY [candidate division Zixibacteria bacterium]